ncbi:nitroreductase family protein [Kordiimonas pumila]|uniref:Putative NAD(P)H nitroreductase n=1 Tax=Kordiimonas pumila TaxID=2161677 RepID=A0ABV7D769_9PROT|nr:nitroreductase [Kordiimonas pumila]
MSFNTPNPATYDLLMKRRSVVARDMVGPGPDDTDLKKILEAGMRVPDHGKLAPWRFIVLRGAEREKLGDLIAEALKAESDTSEKTAEKMKDYASQGPVLVVSIFSPQPLHPAIPYWEQQLSAGASCQNMLIAATALGYASQWLTGWGAFSRHVMNGLGLNDDECISGLMFFGHQAIEPTERARPDVDKHIIWGFPEGAGA